MRQIGEGPITHGMHIVNFGTTVVDLIVILSAVAGATSIFRDDNDVTLVHQLTNDVHVRQIKMGVYTAVDKHHERRLLIGGQFFRSERVQINDQGSSRALPGRILHADRLGAGDQELVDAGDIGKLEIPGLGPMGRGETDS